MRQIHGKRSQDRPNVVAENVPVGFGEPIFGRLDAEIAHAMMGINAVKGVVGVIFQVGVQLGGRARAPCAQQSAIGGAQRAQHKVRVALRRQKVISAPQHTRRLSQRRECQPVPRR